MEGSDDIFMATVQHCLKLSSNPCHCVLLWVFQSSFLWKQGLYLFTFLIDSFQLINLEILMQCRFYFLTLKPSISCYLTFHSALFTIYNMNYYIYFCYHFMLNSLPDCKHHKSKENFHHKILSNEQNVQLVFDGQWILVEWTKE